MYMYMYAYMHMYVHVHVLIVVVWYRFMWPHAIEHAYNGSKWLFWRMAIKTPNSPNLIPSKISCYIDIHVCTCTCVLHSLAY